MTHIKKKIILIIVLVFAALLIAFAVYNHIDTVSIKGCQYYSEDEIKDSLLTGVIEKNSVLLYLKARYIGFKDLPYIEKISVKRVNNHQVSIYVYEKPLIACVKYMSQYLYFDKDGIILEASSDKLDGIPCISGLTFSEFKLYEPLKVEEKAIFTSILELSQIIDRYELTIDKIHFNTNNEVTLSVGNIKVYLGKRDFYDEPIAALSEILPDALEQKLKGSIDMENYQPGDRVIFRVQS